MNFERYGPLLVDWPHKEPYQKVPPTRKFCIIRVCIFDCMTVDIRVGAQNISLLFCLRLRLSGVFGSTFCFTSYE
jgi:hypothetical protein